jgi:hypothetical protein
MGVRFDPRRCGAALLLACTGLIAGAESGAQLLVRERVTVRIPMRQSRGPLADLWRERKADRCIALDQIGGAAIARQNSVDFILRGGRRVRAKLENSCPSLDFYSGFYLRPTADGRICADRDSIHSRAGGECTIDRFRQLELKQKPDQRR